jgi:hypothetical protein
MFKQLFGFSDEKRMATKLCKAYFEASGFEAEALEDGKDLGDWLGLGDKLMVSEVKSFDQKTGDFIFCFLTTDKDNNLVKNQSKLNIKRSASGYVFTAGNLSEEVAGENGASSLKSVIEMAKKVSAIV